MSGAETRRPYGATPPAGATGPDSFSAKRRAARSSQAFQLLLAASLVLCLVLAWHRGSLTSPQPAPPQPALMARSDARADEAQLVMASSPARASSLPLRIVTYNIRFASRHQVANEKPWAERRPRLCGQARFITAGRESPFLCLQEALDAQVHDVQAGLGPGWAFIGRGRGHGEADGEFSPIFYRSDTWTCTRNQTRWLSPTPDEPSRGWDAALARIVTMGRFQHNATGTSVVVINTHLDHVGRCARAESVRQLLGYALQWGAGNASTPAPAAVLVTGDFNSEPDDDAYQLMVGPGAAMSDMSNLVPEDRRYGNNLTYTTFGEPDERPQLIDFLFIREPRTAIVKTYGVLPNSFDDGLLLSDHRPVVADLDIKVEPVPKASRGPSLAASHHS